jgi:hypothetical protein
MLMKVEKLVTQQYAKRKVAWNEFGEVLEFKDLMLAQIAALADTIAVMKTECHGMR